MCLCPKELLNMTPGSREGGKKCHTTHRCNTQTGRITDITLGSAQPSTPAVGECNPRRAIKQGTLFYQQLKQDSVIHSPRYLSSCFKKKKKQKNNKYCGITNTKTLFISYFE